MAKADLTAARLRELLHYDPEAGTFTWLARRQGTRRSLTAGSLNANGYVVIGSGGYIYPAHRLAWLYMTGKWPLQMIDHIDGDRANNRFSNIREATPSLNAQNQKKAHVNNKSTGLMGVAPTSHGKWRASLFIDGKLKHLGCFSDPGAAHQAYLTAKRSAHEGCTI